MVGFSPINRSQRSFTGGHLGCPRIPQGRCRPRRVGASLMRFRKIVTVTSLIVAGTMASGAAPAAADPPHRPGGPCIQENQNVSRSSVAGYDDVVQGLDRIARTSNGLVEVQSAGRSGEGRELLYAKIGAGPDVFWLQARIHGDELHGTESALQVLKLLAGESPDARLIREKMTLIVVPMYNPDGAEANIRQSTTPTRIDLNRDWENFAQPESRAWYPVWTRFRPRDPSRMTDLQWLTARQMSMVTANALTGFGQTHIARYPEIDITNAVLSRMLLGGPGPDGSDPGFKTQGAIFYEIRSVGQKSNGYIEQMFNVPTMALLTTVAQGRLGHPHFAFERFAERIFGGVAESDRQRADAHVAVTESALRQQHSPAVEVGQRWHARHGAEAFGERRSRHRRGARQLLQTPRLRGGGVHERERRTQSFVGQGAQPSGG